METFDDYINQMINEGFIKEDGTPIRCVHCESKNLIHTDPYFEGGYTVEYSVVCKDCKKNTGHWSYGQWEV